MMRWINEIGGWGGYVLLVVAQTAGLALNLLGMPGLWLMVLALIAYAWATGWGDYVGWWAVLGAFTLALAAEAVEFAAGAVGSKAAGGSKRGMVGAIVGGVMGAIVGTPFLPPLGTVAGACVGCFVGAFFVEKGIGRNTSESAKIGAGAAVGRFVGIVTKTGFGLAIFALTIYAAFGSNADLPVDPSGPSIQAPALPSPTPLPAPALPSPDQPSAPAPAAAGSP